MLCSDANPNPTDIREPLAGEDPIDEAFVNFFYVLSHDELNKVVLNIKKKILCSDLSKPLIKRGDTELSLNKFLKEINEINYEVNLKNAKKTAKYWTLSNSYTVLANWKRPSSSAPATYNLKPGTEIELNTKSLIDINKYKEIPEEFLEDVNPEYVNGVVGKELVSFFDENLPECIFWEYEDKNLLPSKINLAQFSGNPDICLPLKHMFYLAKYLDIPTAFKEAKERSPNQGINNLLENVAEQTTKHFQSIWKDYQSIKFYLGENGDYIDAAVKEKNRHDFDRRSDGFKRFVTFLLMISAKRRLGELKDFPHLELNDKVEEMAQVYMERLEIPKKSFRDAAHLAIACVHNIDYLVTWNCAHLANGEVIKKLMKINESIGIHTPIICTPEELMEV